MNKDIKQHNFIQLSKMANIIIIIVKRRQELVAHSSLGNNKNTILLKKKHYKLLNWLQFFTSSLLGDSVNIIYRTMKSLYCSFLCDLCRNCNFLNTLFYMVYFDQIEAGSSGWSSPQALFQWIKSLIGNFQDCCPNFTPKLDFFVLEDEASCMIKKRESWYTKPIPK